jgi:hypothetical protein
VNLGDLVARVRSLSGIRLDALRSDSEIEQVVNESYQEILGLYPWPFLKGNSTVSMSAEAKTFTVPTTFRWMTGVVLTMGDNTHRLKQTTLDQMDEWDDDSVGEPAYYARVTDRTVKVWPAPEDAASVTVRGQLEFESLTNSGDVPEFAEQFHPVIAYRAATRLLQEEGDDSGRSEAYQFDAASYLGRMEKFYMGSGDIGLIRIGSQRERRRAR